MKATIAPRRFLVLTALTFWQGGFVFYSAVVVPIGGQVYGPVEQGFVTRQVTTYLNLSGAVTLVILGLDVLLTRDPLRARRWARWLTWSGMVAALVLLFVLHPWLDALLDPEQSKVLSRVTFRPRHRLYLWVSTFQWTFAVVFSWCTLLAWREEDRSEGVGRKA